MTVYGFPFRTGKTVIDYEKCKILGITPKKIAYNGIIEEFNNKLRIKQCYV